LTAEDQEAWGKDGAAAALDDFVTLDQRVKEIVTAWQMREVDGEPILNDHTDLDYDGRVLADFAALAREADAWLAPLEAGLPRLDRYRHRLARAAGQVANGDHQYIASPRLDSYHNIWFELHEDLILLAGRTREDEVAAGRA
jgi:pyruvate,orthophosphate dikinase